jgi:hypothetical protein
LHHSQHLPEQALEVISESRAKRGTTVMIG